MREVRTDADAGRERFVGSPTIRVDGRDVQPPDGEPAGLTCRVYRLRDGRISPLPDRAGPARDAGRTRSKEVASDGSSDRDQGWRARTRARAARHGGRIHTLPAPGEAPATVVLWTCNHCPYALAWHDRLVQVARDYGPRGVRFLAVNSNDAERYPRDSLEAMRERVRDEDWPFPYLHDESQQAAREWAAQVTPHVYVLDGDLRVRYEGAPDGDHMDPAQNAAWLREALDDLLSGREVSRAETEPVGCSIKWK